MITKFTGVKSVFLGIILRICYPPGDRLSLANLIKRQKNKTQKSLKMSKTAVSLRSSLYQTISLIMAEKEGFEPVRNSVQLLSTCFAVGMTTSIIFHTHIISLHELLIKFIQDPEIKTYIH